MKLAPNCLICREKLVIDIIECQPCTHIYHSECIRKWLGGRGETNKSCPLCRTLILGERHCMKHKDTTATEISPLVLKHLGLGIVKEIKLNTLKSWLCDCEIEGAKLDSAASALMKNIQENVDKHHANGKLLGAFTEEIRQREKQIKTESNTSGAGPSNQNQSKRKLDSNENVHIPTKRTIVKREPASSLNTGASSNGPLQSLPHEVQNRSLGAMMTRNHSVPFATEPVESERANQPGKLNCY